MHILLVEDSDTLATLFRVQLRQLGPHSLTVASTKTQALAALKKERFDLALVDMGLEGHQDRGLEVLAELKRLTPGQRAGVLSSNDLRDMVRMSQNAGAEFYMVKPFTMEGLALILEGDKEALHNYIPEAGEGRIIVF
jgi:two-component system chemotaxis response regulator CheY